MEENKKRILVVDDERTNLVRAKMLLQEEFVPILVSGGQQCLDYLAGHRPDLILLDIMMPEMNGWEVMRRIQENEEWKHIPVIFLTADSKPETEAACFEAGAVDFSVKPIQPVGIMPRIHRTIELDEYRYNLEKLVAKQERRINEMKYEFIVSMSNLVDNRDITTGEHIKRTANVAWRIGRELLRRGEFSDVLDMNYVETIRLAAPMHDIGKIKISDTILMKPGKLTEAEFEKMKEHTVFGKEVILDTLGNLDDQHLVKIACEIAAYHHEKYNGTGYPEGLKGEEIPLCARIMAVADVYDALKEKRCYKAAFPLEEVYEIMQEDAGSHFDPKVLEAFMSIREEIVKNEEKK
ncbi:MAG: response regulator [Lachnospiraceae bacterium]|jgi:putative two-component system response regulator|nr:response regulator [Lachnospiraceae bacterium]